MNYLGELFYCTVTSWEAEKKHRRLSLKRQSGRKKLSIKTVWKIVIQKLQVVITSASCMNPQPQECMVAGLVLRPQCLDSRDLGSGHWLVPAALRDAGIITLSDSDTVTTAQPITTLCHDQSEQLPESGCQHSPPGSLITC